METGGSRLGGKKVYTISDSVPHITLLESKGAIENDLGPMMKQAKISKWNKTDNPLIYHSTDEPFIKILVTTVRNGHPKEVEVTAN